MSYISRGTVDGSNIDHDNLLGLLDDDHIQYILANGTRAFSGNQSFGDNNITNVGTLNMNGLIGGITTKTGSYTATTDDYVIICDAGLNSFIVNLPAASSNTGRIYYVKKVDSSQNTITINPEGAGEVDNGATAVITTQFEAVTVTSDGSNWWII